MSLKITAQHLANQGRGNDSSLVHMSPREISALNDLARSKGQNLTINPQTGLPEAGLLEDLLPAVVGGALNFFAPGVGTAVGGLFGLGGAAGTGIAVGALSGLASGNLGKGLMAGLGAYGGAGVTEGIAGLGMGNIGRQASEAAVNSATQQGLTGEAYNKAVQESVAQRMADVPMSEKFGAGMDFFKEKPMEAAKVLGKSALTAAAPIFAGQNVADTVQTVTPRQSSRGYIRPYSYDRYNQTMRAEEPYEAANGGLMSVASGGAAYADGGTVGYADGGMTLTPEQIKSAIDISRQQGFSEADVATGLGRYITNPAALSAALAANPLGGANITDKSIYNDFGGSDVYSNPLNKGFGATANTAQAAAAPTQSAADTMALQPSWTSIGGKTGLTGLDQNISGYANKFTPAAAAGLGLTDQASIEARIRADMAATGVSDADFLRATGKTVSQLASGSIPTPYNPNASRAEYWVSQPGWTSTGGLGGVTGLNQNIAGYAANLTPTGMADLGLTDKYAVEARIRSDMGKYGVSDSDIFRATGKTVSQLAEESLKKTLIKAPVKDLAPGVGGQSGPSQTGGGSSVNPNGTITTSPNIPGIPAGGFTGMGQVRDAYTSGGGRLGILPSFIPKTVEEMNARYPNTGDSKAMYDYLTGKGPYPVKTGMGDVKGSIREVARPYNEAVLGQPASANKPYIWDPVNGKYLTNPDYVRQATIKDPTTGKLVSRNFMSINQVKSALNADQKLTGNSLVAWAKRNNVDQQTLADALGKSVFDIQKMFLDADEVGAAKNGGLMSLAKGGLAYAAGGGIEDVTDPATGEKYIYDYREGGRFRKAIVVKDGVTYKWNPVTKKYEVTSGNAGVDTLMNNQTAGGGGQTNFEPPSQFDTPSGIGIGGRTPLAADYLSGKISGFFAGPRTDAPAPVEDRTPTATPTPANTAAADYASQVAAQTQAAADADAMANAMSGADGSNLGNAPQGNNDGLGGGSKAFAYGGMAHYAQGGLGSLGGYSDGGQLLRGPGDGVSDNIPATIGGKQPARLADGEFVVSADVVSGLGNGSTEAGARKLYAMMDRVRKARTGTKKMGRTIHPEKFIPS